MVELRGNKGTLALGAAALVSLAIGILIGHLITPSGTAPPAEGTEATESLVDKALKTVVDASSIQITKEYETEAENQWEKEKHLVSKILERIDPNNIKENLRYLSEKPHLAATERDVELAEHIRDRFLQSGFDFAQLLPSNFYLSKPDPENPNKVTLHESGAKIFESQHKEVPIHPDDEDPNFVHAFNAFTPAGTVSTEPGVGVVYVNYGRFEDFEKLGELGINITGHIALARYGKIYRGNKVRHAEQFGAVGIIIFSDPADVALDGVNPKDVYDNSWWLPSSGMQRGSTFLGDGDPLTPGWPSTEHAYRIAEDEAGLHKIPCQPIGYGDARVLLERLAGESAPEDWQGGLPGLTYKLGPFFGADSSNVTVTLSTHNRGKIETSYNVIGVIRGNVESDRYVLIGNHRDAWGYGASDPSSGTAQLLETARVLGSLRKEGWRPRRTLVFMSWGSEEFGLIGSTEWVEEHVEKLQDRAVAYINTDTCASGPALQLRASPLMQEMFYDVTKMIPGVVDDSRTLFEEWKEYSEKMKPEEAEHPIIKPLGSGSDYAHFSIYAGVPAADVWFRRDEVKHNISMYPYYHTGYETFYMVSTFVDPEFKIHQGCSRLASLSLKYLADSSIIPYGIGRFPKMLTKMLESSKHREKLMQIYDKYVELEKSVKNFEMVVSSFERKIRSSTRMDPLQIRAINDQMMKLEQMYIIPEGLPGRPATRNAVFSPSQFDNYSADGFPGLADLLHKYETLEEEERMERDKKIRRHISDLTIMTDRASSFLRESHLI